MFNKKSVRNAGIKVSHWLWFGLILSLVPIAYSVWKLCGINGNDAFDNFTKAISHGELMLICMSTLAASIGEISFKDTEWKFLKVWLTGATTVLALFTVLGYAEVAVINSSEQQTGVVSLTHALDTSMYIFWATVSLALACLILPEKDKKYVV